MSPREKHIPDDAQRTSVGLTAEDREPYTGSVRSAAPRSDKRTTINDILVDALWYFLERTEAKTKDQIRAMIPAVSVNERPQSKVAEMPKTKNRR